MGKGKGKVSSAKKQRDKKKIDKLHQKKEKEDKMRRVLASLAIIAPTKNANPFQGKSAKTEEATQNSNVNSATQHIDKDAMYKEFRSTRTMKRKWRDSSAMKKLLPKPTSDVAEDEESSEEEEENAPVYSDEDNFEAERERKEA